ncbi:hypothetical protein ABG067_004117 [Albugo candida]
MEASSGNYVPVSHRQGPSHSLMMNHTQTDLTSLRVRKDISELAKSKFSCQHAQTRIDFPDGIENMLHLLVRIRILDDDGPYKNGNFTFYIEIPKTYPFSPPSVTSLTRVWHPNIDVVTGKVMISILGKDWRPVLTINTVLLALQLIFIEPGIDTILNKQASEQLKQDPQSFCDQVQRMLQGGIFYDLEFPKHPSQAFLDTVPSLRTRNPKRTLERVKNDSCADYWEEKRAIVDECNSELACGPWKRARHL